MTENRLTSLRSRPLFVMQLAVDPFLSIGSVEGLEQRVGVIPGGHFEGDRLRGTILPGGADWQTVQSDGTVQLDGRVVMRTADDVLIAMAYKGIRHGSPEVMARLGRGELVDPGEYYFRIVPSLSTGSSQYNWLNRVVAVGTGFRSPEGPTYFVHEIL